MNEPQEIQDEEHEQVHERVAAIDVAKASGMVCVRVPHESKPGRRVSRVWEVPATTRAVIELGDHLVCRGGEKVTAESTPVIRGCFHRHQRHAMPAQVTRQGQQRLGGRPVLPDLLTAPPGLTRVRYPDTCRQGRIAQVQRSHALDQLRQLACLLHHRPPLHAHGN
jgi:hypothetical protein